MVRDPIDAGAGVTRIRNGHVPIALDVEASPLHGEDVRRFELADAPIGGQWRGHVPEREIGVDRGGAPFARHTRVAQQRSDLGGEHDAVIRQQREVQRTDPDVVARENQPPVRRIPDRARERTAQPREGASAPLRVGAKDQLAVDGAVEAVPQILELRAQRRGVRDRGIRGHTEPLEVVCAERSQAGVTARSERNAGRGEDVAAAGVLDGGIEHLLQHRTRERLLGVETELADDAAHGLSVEQARCQ